jgi:hypothetical protein
MQYTPEWFDNLLMFAGWLALFIGVGLGIAFLVTSFAWVYEKRQMEDTHGPPLCRASVDRRIEMETLQFIKQSQLSQVCAIMRNSDNELMERIQTLEEQEETEDDRYTKLAEDLLALRDKTNSATNYLGKIQLRHSAELDGRSDSGLGSSFKTYVDTMNRMECRLRKLELAEFKRNERNED